MANYGTDHFIIAAIISIGDYGSPMTAPQLIKDLYEKLEPWGDDLLHNSGRDSEPRFHANVRNLTGAGRTNDMKQKFFVFGKNEKGDQTLWLTDFGKKIYANLKGTKVHTHLTTSTYPIQIIYYGAPGTGKSYRIAKDYNLNADNTFRTTFHPDTDYASFVGCYKPKSQNSKEIADDGKLTKEQLVEKFKEYFGSEEQYKVLTKFGYDFYHSLSANISQIKSIVKEVLNKSTDNFSDDVYIKAGMDLFDKLGKQYKQEISYTFTEQVFTQAYVQAWLYYSDWKNKPAISDEHEPDKYKGLKPVFLIIDEINRGNCAQIFGDIFQLLDRNDDAFSDYEIQPDADLQNCISKKGINVTGILNQKEDDISSKINDGSLLKFPPNLCIIATMNTSDQSLFPMDSAFKRRWDWEYVGINYSEAAKLWVKISDTEYYNWGELIRSINSQIKIATSSADKQIGNWFVHVGNSNIITLKQFVNKVLFYLWNDVYKDLDKDDEGYIFNSVDSFESFFEPDSDEEKYDSNEHINLEMTRKFIRGLNGVHLYDNPQLGNKVKDENDASQPKEQNPN